MPWHLERLTLEELNEYSRQLDAHNRAVEKANREAARR